MAGEEGGGEAGNGNVTLKETVLGECRTIKEHAETYPYVWGSYILVYGGLGAYYAIRRRAVRRKEDSVSGLLARLREIVRHEEMQAGSSSPPPSDKSSGSS